MQVGQGTVSLYGALKVSTMACKNAGATTRQNQGQKESRYGRPCLAPAGLGAVARRESSRSHRFVARKLGSALTSGGTTAGIERPRGALRLTRTTQQAHHAPFPSVRGMRVGAAYTQRVLAKGRAKGSAGEIEELGRELGLAGACPPPKAGTATQVP